MAKNKAKEKKLLKRIYNEPFYKVGYKDGREGVIKEIEDIFLLPKDADSWTIFNDEWENLRRKQKC